MCKRWFGLLWLLLLLPASSDAATIQVLPPQESAVVGSIVSVPVTFSTEDPVNAVSAVIAFPSFLEPISVTVVGSPISLWIVAPSINAPANTVAAEGIILGEGIVGTATLLTVQARVRGPGEGYVFFERAAVLAHDGLGTNILENIDDGKRFFASVPQDPRVALPIAEPVLDGAPTAPVITRYSSRVRNIEDFFVEGRTYADARVFIAIRLQGITEQHETMSDRTGNFRFTYPKSDSISFGESLKNVQSRLSAAVFTLEGIEYEFWVWAEKDGTRTPETHTLGVAVEGFSWDAFSVVLDPTTLLIIVLALLGFLFVAFFGLAIIRAVRKGKGDETP